MWIYLHPAGRFFLMGGSMRIQGPERRGSSLIEVAIVLAILGILAALAVPSFTKALPGIRLKGDVRDVASVAKLARMRAVAEGAPYGVYFDEGSSPAQFVFFQDVDQDGQFNSLVDDVVFTRGLYRRTQYLHVNFPANVAVFVADGSSNGGWVSMGLVGSSDSLVVDILPSTGRVKVVR